MLKSYIWNQLSSSEQSALLERPAVNSAAEIEASVRQVRQAIEERGDAALYELTEAFDGVKLDRLTFTQEEIDAAAARIDEDFKAAIRNAYDNIYKFHLAQRPKAVEVVTQEGVFCEVLTRPIERVGLYIPGGSAPLFSTILMLAIPAQIAGCEQIVLATPPNVADEILYVAQVCGIERIYSLGGAQAIFALALGTESVEKVDKIFGPGNSYVTAAKQQASQIAGGVAIDMPAGPSEVLVIADGAADPAFVASDLLSQAEHGADSQVILVTTSQRFAEQVADEIEAQLKLLPRAQTAAAALAHSRTIIAADLDEAAKISNEYAPEHLIIQTERPRDTLDKIKHAGSVFLGAYSPESMGDYASGTNHVLPTYGYARTYSSLGVADFSKRMTVQELTKKGFAELAPTVALMAERELLDAHKLAVELRLERLQEEEEK